MDTDEFKKMIKEFISDTHPDDTIESFDINSSGVIEIVMSGGDKMEIEVDWSELVLK